jgi:transcriptional regulator GlxA family with amidase domain
MSTSPIRVVLLGYAGVQTLDLAGPIDTLIVPGGAALRTPRVYEEIAEAVMRCSAGCRRIVSVCTGIYGVAPTGLLDARRATTH